MLYFKLKCFEYYIEFSKISGYVFILKKYNSFIPPQKFERKDISHLIFFFSTTYHGRFLCLKHFNLRKLKSNNDELCFKKIKILFGD